MLGGDKAPAGSFHGKNVMVYATGLIGPRPGLRDYTPASMPVGRVRGLAETPVPDREALFVIADTAYYSSFRDTSIAPVAFTGDNFGAYGGPIKLKPDTTTFLVATLGADGGVWRLTPTSGVAAQLPDSPAGIDHEIYNAQLIVVAGDSTPRLLGSAPSADGVTYDFSDGMFIDVGDNWDAVAVYVQRNYLAIFKRNSIHVLSGVFGTDNMVVRQISRTIAAHKPWHVAIDNDDRIWWVPLFRENVATFNGTTIAQLAQYDGLEPRNGEDEQLPQKRGVVAFEGQLTSTSAIATQYGDTASQAILSHNGVISFHEYEVPVSGLLYAQGNHVTFTDGGDESTAAHIYACNFEYDRPGFTTDDNARPGDGSNIPLDAEFELPYFFTKDGGSVRVRSVTVEVVKWNTGVATNTLTCTATTLNRPQGAGDSTGTPQVWAEAASAASVDGSHDRLVLPMHLPKGQGFGIKLSGIVGVAIKSVTVNYETDPNLPRDDNS